MTCPHCQEAARFKGYRQKGLLSALGIGAHLRQLLSDNASPSPLPEGLRTLARELGIA